VPAIDRPVHGRHAPATDLLLEEIASGQRRTELIEKFGQEQVLPGVG